MELSKRNNGLQTGRWLGSSHKIMQILGEGAYAVVMKCHNFRLNKLEASSICLSFELLDIDLGRYVSGRSRTRCLTVAEVRPILHQVTTALFHLKSLGIIHCDVKPENILCVDRRQQPLQVKLADFGLARVAYNFNPVLVGRNYNEAIDMWSLGATAAGLVLGSPLYLVKNEYDALRAIIKTQGQLSDQLLDQGSLTEYYFVKNANSSQKWTLQTREVHERQTGCRPVQKLITLNKMLHLDPKERVEPLQALLHGFFTEDTPSGPDPSTPLGKD
uniref:Protein kinase domain-containing protein n=1 Tax=Takifugu rubripes TaxID=31033 RepID=A0A674N134_TAKRU